MNEESLNELGGPIGFGGAIGDGSSNCGGLVPIGEWMEAWFGGDSIEEIMGGRPGGGLTVSSGTWGVTSKTRRRLGSLDELGSGGETSSGGTCPFVS